MASVNPTTYDGFWVELNTLFQTTDVRISPPESVQVDNMATIYNFFIAKGWTPNAIAGMLGNIMVESTVNPWLFQNRSLNWNNPAGILADNGGMGLTQWTPCRKYYQWAIDNNMDPASGFTMLERIVYESQHNLQWSLNNYGRHTWNDFITSTEDPWVLADVWCWAYERPSSPDMQQRWSNAEWVFENITGGGITIPIMLLLIRNKRKEIKRKWTSI